MTVALHLPAEAAYAAVLRTLAATLAARCELTYDRVEDARLAADEAFAQLVSHSPPGTEVACTFTEEVGSLHFTMSCPTTLSGGLPTDTFGWTVLSALANEVSSAIGHGLLTVSASLHEHQDAAA